MLETDRQLNLSKRNMYRVFNDAEMTLGGRFLRRLVAGSPTKLQALHHDEGQANG